MSLLTQLTSLANKLDEMGYIKTADEIDLIIKALGKKCDCDCDECEEDCECEEE